MCCIAFIVKYLLFIVNLLVSLIGVGIVVVGVIALLKFEEVLELFPFNVNIIPAVVITLGCIVFLIAFFGCCGAITEQRCLLITYAVCMALLAAVKIYLAVLLSNNLGHYAELAREWLETAFQDPSLRETFYLIEALLQCCGTTGGISYDTYPLLPPTCCAVPEAQNYCLADNAYGGCTAAFQGYIHQYGQPAVYILAIIIAVELVAMIFASYLSHSIESKKKEQYTRRLYY